MAIAILDILKENNIASGFDLLTLLHKYYYVGDSNSWWWPNFLSQEIKNGIEIKGSLDNSPNLSLCFAAILGQNTKYEYASLALTKLYNFLFTRIVGNNEFDIDKYKCYQNPKLAYISQPSFNNVILELIANLTKQEIAPLIQKSGFYNQKSIRIITLANNIIRDFNTFESFSKRVDKEWLLSQSGIGLESATSILNYALKREEMVVDRYTQRLLSYCGIIYQDYQEIQAFLTNDLYKAHSIYDFDISYAQIMARLHGKIVECSKHNKIRQLDT